MRLAIDTGGTFTDLIVEDDRGECRIFKARTTPSDPIAGVLDAISVAADAYGVSRRDFLEKGQVLVHGTTHAINAIITGRTARTALLTTAGHKDILVLREGGRSDPFNFTEPYPQPFILRSLTFEVPERIRFDGSVETPLDDEAVVRIAADLKAKKVEAVAVCLLWSIVNAAHEERVGALLATHLPGVPYTLSHALNPSIREFRRASSAAIDASLKPMMSAYMRTLEDRLREAGFSGRTLIVTSGAGVIDAHAAADAPIHIVNSGPSMAPLAGRHYSDLEGSFANAIVADTGGTTYDVSLIRNGRIPTSRETWVGARHRGVMIGFPWVDVKSVGAGGGSIAWVDAGGLLRVGPKSAGAEPGPVAYRRGGTEPTVTDACLAMGHLDSEYFLGGAMRLDRALAETAIYEKIAKPLGLEVVAAADAILAIATENMVQAIVDITVNQGLDPREAALVGGGGAAGLNSVRIARRLGCKTLIIPEVGSALSAAGALMSDLKAEHHLAFFTSTAAFDYTGARRTLEQLAARCRGFIEGPGKDALRSVISYKVSARYASQVWEIEVPLRGATLETPDDVAAFVEDFHKAHAELFAFADPSSHIDIIGWSAEVGCRFKEKDELRLAADKSSRAAPQRRAYFRATGWGDIEIREFAGLPIGEPLSGPAVIENSFTTIVLEPGSVAVRRPSGSLLIDVGIDT